MNERDTPELNWVAQLRRDRTDRQHNAALIADAHERQDDDERQIYEGRADPDAVRMETAQRQFRGHYLGRLRRLSQRARHDE